MIDTILSWPWQHYLWVYGKALVVGMIVGAGIAKVAFWKARRKGKVI